MTISITVSQCSFEGDGSSVTFPIADGDNGIYFTSADEIEVLVDGDVVLASAYSVSGAGSDSGTVTFSTAPADGAVGIIRRNTALTQALSLTRGGYLSPTSVMDALDKATRIDQDQQRQIDDHETRIVDAETVAADVAAANASAVAAAGSAAAAAASGAAAADSETAALGYATTAEQALANVIADGGESTPFTRLLDNIAGGFNGSTTGFNLTYASQPVSPFSASQVIVRVGGVTQKPGSDYTVSSSTITFTTAPASGLSCALLELQAYINAADIASSPTGDVAATDVQAAIAELASEKLSATEAASIYAPKASPTFTGTPAAPTASPGTNTTQVATTAFVTAAVVASTTGVASVDGKTGAVTGGVLDNIAGSFNGSTTTFALAFSSVAFTPNSVAALRVILGGVEQVPTTDYTVSTTNIIFTTAPASGLTCMIRAFH